MVEDVYEKLAKKLDAHPSGFPRTKSGIELKLLKKIFTEEEAKLANELQWAPETVAQICERTGRDPAKTADKRSGCRLARLGRIHGMGTDRRTAHHVHHINAANDLPALQRYWLELSALALVTIRPDRARFYLPGDARTETVPEP